MSRAGALPVSCCEHRPPEQPHRLLSEDVSHRPRTARQDRPLSGPPYGRGSPRGDAGAVERLTAGALPPVHHVIGRAAESDLDVDDIVQDMMVAVIRALPELRDTARFRSWLVAIAVRQLTDARRRETGPRPRRPPRTRPVTRHPGSPPGEAASPWRRPAAPTLCSH
ncbi:sigma-70 family RNA polymerase sigma factor [Streptomyces koyangensis]|uniref:sigma-70 family RNA polymerase sigma factor n=1 Tax=Streptomyces koyangensis TaxID=188770 RepID=UPI003C2B7E0D